MTRALFDLLLLPHTNLNQIASVIDPLRAANRVLGREAYGWRLFSQTGEAVITTAGIEIGVEGAFDPGRSDVPLFVLASYRARGLGQRKLARQLRAAAARDRMLIGVETGGWLMAEAGLLDGMRVAMHWEYVEDMQAQFPDIEVTEDRFLIDWGRKRATTSGSDPTLDFICQE